jgi:hypothetical protein
MGRELEVGELTKERVTNLVGDWIEKYLSHISGLPLKY